MKHIRTLAVTRLFEGEVITRDSIMEAVKAAVAGNIGSRKEYRYEWRFDRDAAAVLMELYLRWIPLDAEFTAEALERGVDALQGRTLFAWKINVIPTDGFRVEILEYEECS